MERTEIHNRLRMLFSIGTDASDELFRDTNQSVTTRFVLLGHDIPECNFLLGSIHFENEETLFDFDLIVKVEIKIFMMSLKLKLSILRAMKIWKCWRYDDYCMHLLFFSMIPARGWSQTRVRECLEYVLNSWDKVCHLSMKRSWNKKNLMSSFLFVLVYHVLGKS